MGPDGHTRQLLDSTLVTGQVVNNNIRQKIKLDKTDFSFEFPAYGKKLLKYFCHPIDLLRLALWPFKVVFNHLV